MAEVKDARMDFMSDYILKSYKLKPDKWAKCIGNEEHKTVILEFLEKADNPQLVFTAAASGIVPTFEFPKTLKNAKAVFFIKRKPEAIGKENYRRNLVYGDLSYSPLEQLSALVDEVSLYL